MKNKSLETFLKNTCARHFSELEANMQPAGVSVRISNPKFNNSLWISLNHDSTALVVTIHKSADDLRSLMSRKFESMKDDSGSKRDIVARTSFSYENVYEILYLYSIHNN